MTGEMRTTRADLWQRRCCWERSSERLLWAVVSASRDFLFLAPRRVPCAHAVQHTSNAPTERRDSAVPRERDRLNRVLLVAHSDNVQRRDGISSRRGPGLRA